MANPMPLVIYLQLDSFSLDLFSLAKNELELSFEMIFVYSFDEMKQKLRNNSPTLVIIEVDTHTSSNFERDKFPLDNFPIVLLNSEDSRIAKEVIEMFRPFSSLNRPRNVSSMRTLIEMMNIILI